MSWLLMYIQKNNYYNKLMSFRFNVNMQKWVVLSYNSNQSENEVQNVILFMIFVTRSSTRCITKTSKNPIQNIMCFLLCFVFSW